MKNTSLRVHGASPSDSYLDLKCTKLVIKGKTVLANNIRLFKKKDLKLNPKLLLLKNRVKL